MNKNELKKILKPLIKPCIKDVILEEGTLSTVISEVIKGTSASQVVFTESASSPPNDSLNIFNIRIKDYAGNWGSLYKRIFLQYDSSALRDLKITSGEYFWDTDPGFGKWRSIISIRWKLQ